MPLVFRYAARSDVGLVRSGNEDSGYASDTLLIVADGMGGHVAGEMASATVTAIIAGLPIADSDDVLTQLADAVDEAQLEMRHIIAERPDFQGMGTTVTAVCWQGDRASLAHVGDSRAYMLRDGQLLRLTKDHTYVQTLVDAGQITEDEAATHRRRNLLIRAIDGVNTVEPDLSIREVHPGDRIMLCTDGLSGVLRDPEIHELLARSDPPGAVTALVDAAIERGAPDNVTCVVADVAEVAEAPAVPRPVVVGAAAEPRTRSQLPGVDFPQDSHLEPSAAGACPAAAPDHDSPTASAVAGCGDRPGCAGGRTGRGLAVGRSAVLRGQRQRLRECLPGHPADGGIRSVVLGRRTDRHPDRAVAGLRPGTSHGHHRSLQPE